MSMEAVCIFIVVSYLPSVLVLGGSNSATSNLSILPSSTPLPSHLPQGNLTKHCSKILILTLQHTYSLLNRLGTQVINYTIYHGIQKGMLTCFVTISLCDYITVNLN